MNAPIIKKGLPFTLLFSCLIIVSAFLLEGVSKKTPPNAPGMYKAVVKEQFRPLPVYGSNSINTRGPAWTDDAFRDSAASMDLKIIRYPGGAFGDYWDWKKGWFMDADEAQSKGYPMPANFTSMKYSPTGLKELKLLVDQSHAEVLFEVNMITRDVNDQIEMLKSAEAMGLKVRWVELGNEFNVMGSAARKKYASASDYGVDCRKWTKAIKENFPGVEVGVVGGNKQYNADVKNWNREVLEEAPNVDAIVAHIYPYPVNCVKDDGIDFSDLYDAFRQDFDVLGFDDVRGKKLWVTEYNILWSNIKSLSDGQAVQSHDFTWSQALACILMTSETTDLPGDPELIVNHGMANWRGFAAIEKRNGKVHMLPNGIGFRAWCEACHDKNELRQISFPRSTHGTAKDYEVLGWQFKGGDQESDLIVNFTSEPVKIDVSDLGGGKTHYNLRFADKEQVVNNWEDIKHEKREIKDNQVELPPYSIATM